MIYYFTLHNKESCAHCPLWRFLCHFCVKVFSSYESSWECDKCCSFGKIFAFVKQQLMFWEKNWHVKCSCLTKENPFSISGFSHSLSPGIVFFPSAIWQQQVKQKKCWWHIASCFHHHLIIVPSYLRLPKTLSLCQTVLLWTCPPCHYSLNELLVINPKIALLKPERNSVSAEPSQMVGMLVKGPRCFHRTGLVDNQANM